MTTRFEERLNQILPRLISPDVLSNQGAGGAPNSMDSLLPCPRCNIHPEHAGTRK